MSRNKFPKKTVENILETSYKLFVEKGYDKTSIQDIMNSLGISKGAIYHHFKSKEEILYAVLEKEHNEMNLYIDEIIENIEGNTALEKLKGIFKEIINNKRLNETNQFFINQATNSKLILESIVNTVNNDSQKIYKLIEDGIQDGSIKTKFPKESAEIVLLLTNIWLNPILFNRNYEETISRLEFIKFTMKQLGIDIIDDELINIIKLNLRVVLKNE